MAERGILYSGAMIRALLDGSKTQTRRPIGHKVDRNGFIAFPVGKLTTEYLNGNDPEALARCPHGAPGDLLYCKETWTNLALEGFEPVIIYRADGNGVLPPGVKWRPSIFLPKRFARIWLEITEVRVERVCDITPADAIAEGIRPTATSQTIDCDTPNPVDEFRSLWESTYPGTWESWCWAISFKRIERKATP